MTSITISYRIRRSFLSGTGGAARCPGVTRKCHPWQAYLADDQRGLVGRIPAQRGFQAGDDLGYIEAYRPAGQTQQDGNWQRDKQAGEQKARAPPPRKFTPPNSRRPCAP